MREDAGVVGRRRGEYGGVRGRRGRGLRGRWLAAAVHPLLASHPPAAVHPLAAVAPPATRRLLLAVVAELCTPLLAAVAC